MQVENCKLKDYGGAYEVFLQKNSGEAEVMAANSDQQKEVAKKQVKSRSKVSFSACLGLHITANSVLNLVPEGVLPKTPASQHLKVFECCLIQTPMKAFDR